MMKLEVPPKYPLESGVRRVQKTCSVGALQSELYRHMAEDMSAPAVFVANPGDGYRLLHASASCRHFGDSHEPLHGKSLPEYIPTLTQAKLKQLWLEVVKYNTTSMETDYRLASGSRIAVEITFSLLEHDGRELMVGYMRDISERRVLEAERLRLAEEVAGQEAEFRYREIFENVTDGISLLDVVDGERFRFAGINPSMTRMTGMIQRNILGRFVENIMPEHSARNIIANYRQCVEEGKPVHFEMELELSSSKKIFNSTLIPVRDGFGHIHRIISLSSDIADRKRVEDTLKFIAQRGWAAGGESFLTALARYLGEMLEVDYVIVDKLADDPANAETVAIYAKGEVLPNMQYSLKGTPCANVMGGGLCCYPADVQQRFPEDSLLVDMQVESYAGLPLWDSKGKVIGLIAVMDGKPIGDVATVTSMLQLVATRASAELEREQHDEALRISEERMRLFFERQVVGMAITSPEKGWIKVNDKVCEMLGYSRDELTQLSWAELTHPEDSAPDAAQFERILNGEIEHYTLEKRFVRKDGDVVFTKLAVACVRRADQSVDYVLAMLEDITERKQYEAALLARAELERRQSQYFAMAPGLFATILLKADGSYAMPFASDGIRDVFGIEPEAVMQDIGVLVAVGHPDDIAMSFSKAEESARNLTPYYVEYRINHPQKGVRWIEVRSQPQAMPDGSVRWDGFYHDITERKRMEAELIRQTNLQRTLLNAMYDVGMQLMAVENGRVIHVGNRKLAYQFGYTDAELDAHPALIDIIHPDDRARVMDYHVRRMAGEAVPTSYELGLLMRDGERREYEVSVAIVPDTDPIRIITVGKDITERKRMEEAIASREQEFRSLAESAPVSIIRYDREGRIRYLNSGLARVLGTSVAEVLGKLPSEAWPDGRYDAIQKAAAQAVETGTKVSIELCAQSAGEPDFFQVHIVPERDVAGQVIGTIAFGVDITAIRTVERRLTNFVANFPGFAYTFRLSPDGHACFPFASPGIEKLYGLKPEDVKDDMAPLHALAHPEDRPRIEAAIAESARTMLPLQEEFRICRPGLPERWMEFRSVPTTEADGSIVWHGLMIDISERKLIQEAVQRSQSALQKAQAIAQLGSWELDLVENVLTWSDEIFRIFEIESALFDASYEAFMATVHPDDREAVNRAYTESLQNRQTYKIEHRLLMADGRIKYVQERCETTYAQDGTPLCSLGTVQDITERKAAERQLALLNSSLDHVNDTVLLISEDASILYVNEEACHILGYPREVLQGMRIADIDPDYQLEGWPDHWLDLKTHGVLNFESRHKTSDGRVYPVDITANYVEFEGLGYNLAICRDITERKQAQEAMQRSQSALEEAQRIGHIGSWEVDMVNDVLTWSDETFRIWEIDKTRFEATFAAFLETVHPEDREKVAHAYNESVSNGTEYQIEHRLLFPDGRVKYIAERGEPFYDADGKPLRFVGTALDITEHKQMEAAVRQQEQEFRVLVEYSPDLIFRYDKECRRTYANPAVERLTGKSAANLRNRVPTDASVLSMREGKKLVQIIRQVLETGQTAESEVEFIAPDGRLHYFHNRYAPEFDSHGEVAGVISIACDITEYKCQQMLEAERQRVFEKMAHGGDLNEILEQVARYVESSKPGRHCCILLLDEERNCLYSAAAPSFSAPCLASLDGVAVREGSCCGAAAWLGEWVLVEDIRHHTCLESCQAFARETGVVACWSEPIVAPSGRVLGVVVIYLNHAGAPGDEDRTLLRHASHLSAIAIERKRIEQQMHHQASYDLLTGLPNRRLLSDRLREEIAKAERGGYRLAVLFIDLDRFKEVNDTLGHVAGDGLLVEAAQRIRACVRESDTVARLAGDEFVVILPEAGEIVPQDRVAQCIVESMARSFLLGEHNVYVSASVGIAVYPQDADNAETLISCADQAMYTAKETGRNSFSFFTCGMLELAQQRLQLASDLREALGKGQLEVYYQPILDVVSGQVVKAEALLRWQHPQRGMVSPDMFIPLAEEIGAIHEIGDWIFRQAAGVALQWQTLCAMGNDSPAPWQISVNMSPRQFVRGNPDVAWVEHLQAIGLNPEAIVIEITEGLLLDDQSDVLNKLQCFRQSGMQLALDDFGTGYSAMAYLKKFNIDYLKIDRSFVRDLETDLGDRAIAEAIVAMAHRLGLKVIAEGVETEGQCAILAEAGCEYVQGYLHAKPMPAEVFLEYVVAKRLS